MPISVLIIVINFNKRFTSNGRARPPFDDSQDITNRVVGVDDGVTTISFTRPIVSDDNDDDLDLDECRYVIWAYGGTVTSYGTNGMNGVFGGHSERGVFPNRICLCGQLTILLMHVSTCHCCIPCKIQVIPAVTY